MANGNYVPMAGRTDLFPIVLPSTTSPAQSTSGHGPPEGVVIGNPGMRYVDIDTTNVYTKIAGSGVFGWVLNGTGAGAPGGGGGGSGNQQIFTFNGNPNGSLVAKGQALCYDTSVQPPNIWIKTTPGTSATDWVLLIGG